MDIDDFKRNNPQIVEMIQKRNAVSSECFIFKCPWSASVIRILGLLNLALWILCGLIGRFPSMFLPVNTNEFNSGFSILFFLVCSFIGIVSSAFLVGLADIIRSVCYIAQKNGMKG